jgi:DNA-binding SARP family transcriptional activator
MITTGGFRYDIMPPLGRILAGTGFLGLTCRLPQTYREGMVEFGILGPLEITAGGQPLPVQGARTRAVLAMLLVHAGQVVPADRLTGERLARDGETALAAGDGALAARRLDEALGLWRGPALADVDDAPFAQAEARRLEERRLAALESRAEALLACGRHRELIGELETLTAAHPLPRRAPARRPLLRAAGRPLALAGRH